MITINLLPGQRRKAAGGPGVLAGLKLPDFSGLIANIKDPWLIGAVVAWVVLGGGSLALFILDTSREAATENRLESVRAEERRYEVIITEKHKAERMRDSLLAEIVVIRAIDADRYVWPHVLDQITKALPPYTWITGVQNLGLVTAPGAAPAPPRAPSPADSGLPVAPPAPQVRVSIDGRTVDFQAYTTFLRQLQASPWLADVTPNTSATVIEQDRPVTSFNVTVRYRVADSVYIRTVPLLQSVR